ncbi:MAG: antibiotic biosynthesis monooxygenase [Rhodoferax sp.]|jgi:heme-degrading monooxygenase HmoA|nr:antibiotic biosynthesis monooxygenase [Rhodoferax sp.]
MILEIADIHIHPGQNAAFEAAIAKGANEVIAHAKGCKGFKVNRSIESPERYVLQVFWETLEDHTVGFRGSAAFPAWRAVVGPFFAEPPLVEHFDLVLESA